MNDLMTMLGLASSPHIKPQQIDVVEMTQRRIRNSSLQFELFHFFLYEGENIARYEVITQKRIPGMWWNGRIET